MSNDDLITQAYNCNDCGAIFKIHHNEVQDANFCSFCSGNISEVFDEDDLPWEPDFDDSIGDDDEEEWD